jgi:hypothetical protein
MLLLGTHFAATGVQVGEVEEGARAVSDGVRRRGDVRTDVDPHVDAQNGVQAWTSRRACTYGRPDASTAI